MTEQMLVEQAREGDENAFAQLVVTNQHKVYAMTLRMTGNPEDAADLAQEAFLKAWKNLHSFQGGSSFSTWLYRLTSNLCIDFLRKEKRKKALGDSVSLDQDGGDGHWLEVTQRQLTPENELERMELRQAVARNLQKLSDEHRQVLTLRELGGLTYEEIAQGLSLSEGTVKSRIARARLALRRLLLEDGNFSPSEASKETEKSAKGGVPL